MPFFRSSHALEIFGKIIDVFELDSRPGVAYIFRSKDEFETNFTVFPLTSVTNTVSKWLLTLPRAPLSPPYMPPMLCTFPETPYFGNCAGNLFRRPTVTRNRNKTLLFSRFFPYASDTVFSTMLISASVWYPTRLLAFVSVANCVSVVFNQNGMFPRNPLKLFTMPPGYKRTDNGELDSCVFFHNHTHSTTKWDIPDKTVCVWTHGLPEV